MYTLRKLTDIEKASHLFPLMDTQVAFVDLTPFSAPLSEPDGFYPLIPDEMLDFSSRAKNGWCMLPNGVGYLSVEQDLPGVSSDMLHWMFAWQGLAPLNYAVLNPQLHHSAAVSDIDRAKICSPVGMMEQKCQGITVFSVEDSPLGLQDNLTLYISPEKMGLTASKYYADSRRVIGGTFIRQLRTEKNPGKKWVGIVLHIIHPTEHGIRVQTRIWIGCRLLRGKIVRLDNVSIQPTPEFTRMLAEQTAQEWAQLAVSLPKAYEITGGKLI